MQLRYASNWCECQCEEDVYGIFKFIHLLGMVLLLGNVTATSVWKVFADRTRDPATIAFAQRLVTGTDWSLTLTGIVLIMAGGYGMALDASMPLLEPGWLLYGQLTFLLSGAIWLGILLPIQLRQAAIARTFARAQLVPEGYWSLSRRWLLWGVAATVPLVASMWVMVMK